MSMARNSRYFSEYNFQMKIDVKNYACRGTMHRAYPKTLDNQWCKSRFAIDF